MVRQLGGEEYVALHRGKRKGLKHDRGGAEAAVNPNCDSTVFEMNLESSARRCLK